MNIIDRGAQPALLSYRIPYFVAKTQLLCLYPKNYSSCSPRNLTSSQSPATPLSETTGKTTHLPLAVTQPRFILLPSDITHTLSSLLFFQTPSDPEGHFAWDVRIFWEPTSRNIHVVVMPDDHSH